MLRALLLILMIGITYNQEISNLFESLKEKEVERQSLLKGISVKKKNKKTIKESNLTEWEEKLKQIEEST